MRMSFFVNLKEATCFLLILIFDAYKRWAFMRDVRLCIAIQTMNEVEGLGLRGGVGCRGVGIQLPPLFPCITMTRLFSSQICACIKMKENVTST